MCRLDRRDQPPPGSPGPDLPIAAPFSRVVRAKAVLSRGLFSVARPRIWQTVLRTVPGERIARGSHEHQSCSEKIALKCGDKSGPGWDRRSRALSVEGTDVWRSWESWRNAAIAVGCTGIRRALWCLASRIKITPESRSTSSTVETDGLAHAHSFSGHGHQPDQRVIRRDGQRPWTLRCRRNQPGDVGARNLVGRRATAPTDQQIAWRHRQCGVEAVQLACESSHHRQSLLPTGTVARPAAGWPTASAASTVGVDAPMRSRSSMNADSNRAWPSNLKPATNEQLRLDFGAQLAAHRPPPGHGRATTRRAARSSLA